MLIIIFFKRLFSNFNFTEINGINSSSISSITDNTLSLCSCAINPSICTPNCCCDPNCPTNIKFDYCLPSKLSSKTSFSLCSDFDSNTVGSVSMWFMRTILCVYKDNNPVTKEEYLKNTISMETNYNSFPYVLQNTPIPYIYLEKEPSGVNSISKNNRGYLFGQEIGTNIGDYQIKFGHNAELNIITDKLTNLYSDINLTFKPAPFYSNIENIQFPIDNILPINSNIIVRTINIFYYSYGYKYGPQYVIKEISIKSTNSQYLTNNYFNFNNINLKNIITKIKFFEIPNNYNFNPLNSNADEFSWLPFNRKGINY